jgi:hypothetical protein
MLSSHSAYASYHFSKIALAVDKNLCYGVCKFLMFNGGVPIALAVKALALATLIPTTVGVYLSASSAAKSYRSPQLLGRLSFYLNSKWYDSS